MNYTPINDTTKRFSRSLAEAFGNNTSPIISEDEPLFEWEGIKIILGVAALLASPYLFIAWSRI